MTTNTNDAKKKIIESITKRWYFWLMGPVILILMLRGCSSDTKVDIDYDNQGKLVVEISGDAKDDYKVILQRNGSKIDERNKSKRAQFNFEIPGTYTIMIKYIGKGKAPKINNFKKGPWIINEKIIEVIPVTPEIKQIIPIANQSIQKWDVTLDMSTVLALDETEFSINGTNFQNRNIFEKLDPGRYTFIARNKNEPSKFHSVDYNLNKITVAPPPSDAVINAILARIANGDDNAVNELNNKVGANTRVTGAGSNITTIYELAMDASQNSKIYRIKSTVSNNKISSLHVI